MRQSEGNALVVVPSPEISPTASFGHRSSSTLLCATDSVGSGPTCLSQRVDAGALHRVHLAGAGVDLKFIFRK